MAAAVAVAGGGLRRCGWCPRRIGLASRADAICCSVRCRQAAHRFHGLRVVAVAASRPLRLAYADPPYPTNSARYYQGHRDFAGEVDHRALIVQLMDDFADGWALSTSAEALQGVLALCPDTVRVAAWVRGERPTRSWRPLSAWEPVIYHGGRAYLPGLAGRRTDALVRAARARTTDADRVVGAKPGAFCTWLFDLLGALPGDHLVDLFPGSGGVGRAWTHASGVATGDASPRTWPDASCGSCSDASAGQGR